MTTLAIVFGLLAAGGFFTSAWLVFARASLAARTEAAELAREDAKAAIERERTEADDRVASMNAKLDEREAEIADHRERAASLSARIEGIEDQHAEALASKQREFEIRERALKEQHEQVSRQLAQMEERSREVFAKTASDTLKQANEQFLQLAKQAAAQQTEQSKAELEKRQQAVEHLVKPLRETMTKTEERLGALAQQVHDSREAGNKLSEETARLSKALSRPEVRGRYGEIQLRRVAELAGMTSYCDFDEQSSTRDDEGNLLRPDMIVKLPAGQTIAVDAKTNTYAYLEAVNAQDEATREQHLDDFARHVAEQAKKLGDKKYWEGYDGSPEFVVMFVPGDHFIDAALARRPELIEQAAQANVILASPSTLIGLLRAVAVGWREFTIAQEARELFELGKQLHERAATAFKHASDLGSSIRQTVERYNKLVGSIDSRVMPTLRKFEESGIKSGKELPEPPEVVVTPRLPAAKES
ncbi:MAG: DNA recombination protein RmuC [Planctomycetota bacterium]